MPIDSAFDQFVICCKMSKNAIRRRSRYPTQFLHICVHEYSCEFLNTPESCSDKGFDFEDTREQSQAVQKENRRSLNCADSFT